MKASMLPASVFSALFLLAPASSQPHGLKYKDCHQCGRRVKAKHIKTVDYLILGAGPAGLSTADDISAALVRIESDETVVLIEKNDHI